MKKTLHLIALTIILLPSCKNIQKMVDKGEYDEAIIYAAEKLQGEEKKETKYVIALEDAFIKVMQQDYDRLDHMIDSERPEFYGKIYNTYKKIERRQQRIRPFLPLVSEDGYVAHFKMIDTRPLLTEYAEKDADYHYGLAEKYLMEYTNDKKHKARSAYRALATVDQYFEQYREKEELMFKAKDLGTEYVYVSTQIGPYATLDPVSWEVFENIDVRGMDKEWVVFHNDIVEDVMYDFKAVLQLTEIKIEAERERAHTFHYNKEVKDGWKYVLDKKGNVKKDSLGNDIKEPKYVNVKARVTEVERQKHAQLLAEVIITDLHSGKEMERHPIEANVDFHGFSCRLKGDKRALEGADRKHKIDRHLEPFPLDEEMIYEAIVNITKEARKQIRREFS